jgi:hypothetical protein
VNLTYFIADAHGFVKIGKTTEKGLRRRFDHLQVANAQPLTLLATVQLSEVSIHCLFRELRVRGEWFQLEPSLLVPSTGFVTG